MYVIVEIAGQQFKAEKGRKLYVHRLQGEENSSVSFDKVLLTDNDGQVKVGAPVVKGASVKCKILKHLKDEKVLVFKKKRRTGYQKCNGPRPAQHGSSVRRGANPQGGLPFGCRT